MFAPKNLYFALMLILTLSVFGKAQSVAHGSVALSGRVSGFVAITTAPNAQAELGSDAAIISDSSNGQNISLSLKGTGGKATEIRVPVLIRSNVGYALAASAKLDGAMNSRWLVRNARSTGRFAAPDALAALRIADLFDARANAERFQFTNLNPATLNSSAPIELLSGTRISLAGTVASPDNALAITISFIVEPPPDTKEWTANLLLSVEPRTTAL
jgi:hypothetical protein